MNSMANQSLKMWVLIAFIATVAVRGTSFASQKPDLPPPGLEAIMDTAKSMFRDTLPGFDFSLRFINHTDSSIEYALIGVQPYRKDKTEIRVNEYPSPQNATLLPYRALNARLILRRFDPPLPPHDTVRIELRLAAPLAALKSAASISLQVFGSGSKNYAITMLSSPLISPPERENLARTVSIESGKRFGYITDAGSWVHPSGLDTMAPASDEEQHPEYGRALEMQSISGDSVEIGIKNDADRTVTISIMGLDKSRIVAAAAHSLRRTKLTEATYSFTGTASGCIPCSGIYSWKKGYRYTWKFWIE